MIRDFFLKADWSPTDDITSAGAIPKAIRARLNPWIVSLLSMSPAGVHRQLAERFSHVETPAVAALKSCLLAEKKYSVLCQINENEEPEAVLAFSEDGYSKFYLPPPVPIETVKSRIRELKLDRIDALEEFVCAFDGFRFLPLGQAGHFEPIASWSSISEHDSHCLRLPKSWDSAIPIFTGPNGDQLLLHKANKLNWTTVGSVGMKLRLGGFKEFIADFAAGKIWDSFSDPNLAKKSTS